MPKKIYNLILSISLILVVSSGFTFFVMKFNNNVTAQNLSLDDQQATIQAIKKVIPAVVSLIVYDQQETVTIDLSTGAQSKKVDKVI